MPSLAEYIFQVQSIEAFEPGRGSHVSPMLASENLQELAMEHSYPCGTCNRPQLALTLANGLFLELSVISRKPGPALGGGEAVRSWTGNKT